MIKPFACKETGKIFSGRFSKKLPEDIQIIGERKLVMLHHATTLDDLRIPPANRLESLSGARSNHTVSASTNNGASALNGGLTAFSQ